MGRISGPSRLNRDSPNSIGETGGLSISDPPTQAEVQALRDKCEEPTHDVRALVVLVNAMQGEARLGTGL